MPILCSILKVHLPTLNLFLDLLKVELWMT